MGFVLSVCPYCSCGCGTLLATEGGRLVGTHPSLGHPSAQGSLCMRGWNAAESPHHPDRLRVPLLRENGRLVETSAEEALATLAQKMAGLRANRSSSVLFCLGPTCANEDAHAVKRLARELQAKACPSDLAGFPAAREAIRRVFGRGYLPDGLDHIAKADLVWIIGADLGACPQVASRLLAATRRGAEVVQFDLFEATANHAPHVPVAVPPEHFRLLPLLLQQAAFAADRIPAAVEVAPTFGLLAERWARGNASPLPAHPWLPDAQLKELVAAFREAKSPAVVVGERWLSTAGAGEATVQLAQALVLLGAQERIVFPVGEANSWGAWDILAPEKEDTDALLALLDPAGTREFDAVFIVGDDLMRRTTRPRRLAQKLAATPLVVLIDRFHSETEAFAHVVLPSVTFAERDGTVTNMFGRVQRWHQAIAPVGESAAEWDWITRIGQRLGIAGWPRSAAEWFEALPKEAPAYRAEAVARLYGETDGAGAVLDETTTWAFSPARFSAAMGASQEFPLRLCFGAHPAVWSTGAISERDEILRREVSQSTLYLSPTDLATLRLRAGSPVKVVASHAEVPMTVQEDKRLPAGVVLAIPLRDSAALRGFFLEADSPSVGVQPVAVRLETP